MEVAERWRERFWFLPAVMRLGAAVAAEVLVSVDENIGPRSRDERALVSPARSR